MTDAIKKVTTFDAEKNCTFVVRGTKKAETDPAPERCEWVIDWNTFTDEQVREHAVKSIVIAAQALYRKDALEAEATLTAETFATKPRQKKAPTVDDAKSVLAGMTAEERIEWLKEQGLI